MPSRILVVDDDALVRLLHSKVLIRFGYRVDMAADGDAAWEMLHAVNYAVDSYDLLITDNNMPRLSGVELTRRLRAERMTLPVIMVSGAQPINTESLQLTALLRKPFSPGQLIDTVVEVLHTEGKGVTRNQTDISNRTK